MSNNNGILELRAALFKSVVPVQYKFTKKKLKIFDDFFPAQRSVEVDDFGQNVRKKYFRILMISYSFVPD